MDGRKNKYYRKDLHQQAYSELTGMQAFGESKKQAILDGTAKDKIFSHASYKTYWKHVKYYIKWINASHPDCKTLRAAKKYVNDWLKERTEQTDEEGRHLSAWTIQTEAAALNKLYHIDKADPERFQPPKRKRSEIKRSRTSTARDKHFSVTNNEELINFCIGTGCRRNVLERLEGRLEKKLELKQKKGSRQNRKPFKKCVEATGFEPTTSASRTQRSTKLSHASQQRNIYNT